MSCVVLIKNKIFVSNLNNERLKPNKKRQGESYTLMFKPEEVLIKQDSTQGLFELEELPYTQSTPKRRKRLHVPRFRTKDAL